MDDGDSAGAAARAAVGFQHAEAFFLRQSEAAEACRATVREVTKITDVLVITQIASMRKRIAHSSKSAVSVISAECVYLSSTANPLSMHVE